MFIKFYKPEEIEQFFRTDTDCDPDGKKFTTRLMQIERGASHTTPPLARAAVLLQEVYLAAFNAGMKNEPAPEALTENFRKFLEEVSAAGFNSGKKRCG